ncbi:MAG: hypothetical protein WBF73_36605, partial [Bradyrhizobium sp.]
LPLEQLSITRERPIFSPARRPPPPPPTYIAPVAVRQPATPPEPESSLYPQEARNGSGIDVAVDPAIPF